MVSSERATMDSSLTTYSSLLMAATDRPAPAESTAALVRGLLPGTGMASMMLWAFFLGSSCEDWKRAWAASDGTVRRGRAGRRRAAPVQCYYASIRGLSRANGINVASAGGHLPTALLARREAIAAMKSGEGRGGEVQLQASSGCTG